MAEHEWVWPNGTKTEPKVNSAWNMHRVHPVFKTPMPHYGTDFHIPDGINRSITDGVVTKVGVVVGWSGGGYGIWVKNWDGSLAKYFHGVKDSNKEFGIKVGSKVKPGQALSRTGMTGTATGVHLHLEISPAPGGANSQVNPEPFIKARLASTSGGDSKPIPTPTPTPQEEKVDIYLRQDADARGKGRTVIPNSGFYLNTTAGSPTSNATNVIGKTGVYDITSHFYVTGKPGDSFSVYALVQTDPSGTPKNSQSYSHTFTFDETGVIRDDASWQFDLSKPAKPVAIYVRLQSAAGNKGDIKVTILDSTALVFTKA